LQALSKSKTHATAAATIDERFPWNLRAFAGPARRRSVKITDLRYFTWEEIPT
jgi:hypothetical protein